MCRPVAVKDFLARLERDFRRHKSDAERALERLPGPGEDTRIYQLRSREQVFEQCRRLLRDATRFVLVDIYPEPLVEIRDDLVAAAKRGVQVVAKTYGDVDVPDIELLIEPEYETVRGRWPGQWVNVVMDGSEYVLGLLSEDGDDVVQAVWSRSPYVSYIHQVRLACEMGYTAIKIDITNDASRDKLLQTFKHTYDYFPLDSPGYERLLQQLKPHPRTGTKKEGIES
jgi:hypothetical protein